MCEKADVTPQPRRRLGLRLPRGASTPGLRRPLDQAKKTPIGEENNSNHNIEAVETPRACPQKPKANSTNCRRLGLTRRRTELSKKRLEFAAQSEQIEVISTATQCDWRQRKMQELEMDIEIWKVGFKAAFGDLAALAPAVPKETLFRQLQIPLDMLQYLDED